MAIHDRNANGKYSKPKLHVLDGTSRVLRGDYGEDEDQYRRFQEEKKKPAPDPAKPSS